MKKIEWIKIPEGQFTPAFSQEQMKRIREKAYQMVKIDSWSNEECATWGLYLSNMRHYWKMEFIDRRNAKWPYDGGDPHEIKELENNFRELEYVFWIERKLARMEALTETSEIKSLYFAPARPVFVKSFYMARFPIIQAQVEFFFDKYPPAEFFFDKNPLAEMDVNRLKRYSPNDPFPVEWDVAKHYCEWVGGRLPTALEWEYAARGPQSLLYPWGNEWDPLRGNFSYGARGDREIRPERLKGAGLITPADGYPEGVSPFGIWDMVGNLPEWLNTKSNKGQSRREREDPTWFYCMPAFNYLSDPFPGYIGFRPVKDKWEPELWPGHKVDSA